MSGTKAADGIVGTVKADVIKSLGGNDRIKGRGGSDRLSGATARDRLSGGRGADPLNAGDGLWCPSTSSSQCSELERPAGSTIGRMPRAQSRTWRAAWAF